MLKQDLQSTYDYNVDALYNCVDDCNFNFIDTSNLKRFLVKCCIYASDALLISIIRRMDLDADARLSCKEFEDGVKPLENFTKGSLTEMKKGVRRSAKSGSSTSALKKSGSANKFRPQTAHIPGRASQYAEIINSNSTQQERNFEGQNHDYQHHYKAMGSKGDYPQLSADVGRLSASGLEARSKVRQSPTRHD